MNPSPLEAHTETGVGDTRLADTFGGFFDDAAIFPPGLAPLDIAVRNHLKRRRTALAAVTGPLILSLDELERAATLAAEAGAAADAHGPLRISLVAPASRLDEVLAAADALGPAATVDTLELKTSSVREQWLEEITVAACIRGRVVFVELDAEQISSGALQSLSGTPLRLKYRTGGIHAELFPTSTQLATVIFGAVALNIPFKLTAGLHEAVRYTNPDTGFTHHGFLNIALATARAQNGGSVADLERILLDTDRLRLTAAFAAMTEHTARHSNPIEPMLTAQWRDYFTAFGTCSISEPIESLESLGLVSVGRAQAVPGEGA